MRLFLTLTTQQLFYAWFFLMDWILSPSCVSKDYNAATWVGWNRFLDLLTTTSWTLVHGSQSPLTDPYFIHYFSSKDNITMMQNHCTVLISDFTVIQLPGRDLSQGHRVMRNLAYFFRYKDDEGFPANLECLQFLCHSIQLQIKDFEVKRPSFTLCTNGSHPKRQLSTLTARSCPFSENPSRGNHTLLPSLL